MALIGQHLFNNLVDTIILWVTVKWKPKKVISFARVKEHFSFGWKLLASLCLILVQ
jgi:O-antigen/teichoic acid export membrane protein